MAYDGEWTVDRMYGEWTHPDDRAPYRRAMAEFLKSGAERTVLTTRFLRRDGRTGWARMDTLAERDPAGRAVRLTGVMSDITTEKAREAENHALLARQEATIEVLRAISASPGDPQPVFELIARKIKDLYGAQAVSVWEYDGALLHQRALTGLDPEAATRLRAAYPRAPGPHFAPGRVVLSGKPDYLRDVPVNPLTGDRVSSGSFLAVPLLHEGRVVGVLGLWRADFGEFNDALVEIAQAFAEQAVIAIASASTLRQLRERTEELAERNDAFSERIEHQAAMNDVLKVMSSTPDDPQPVFDQIAERARAFCNAEFSGVLLRDGDLQHLAAVAGSDSFVQQMRGAFPSPVGPHSIGGRVFLSGEPVLINDTFADAAYSMQGVGTVQRSAAAVPILRDGVAIGAIGIGYTTPSGFTETQVELLKTFAEQAVIAISSAETYRALQERTAELAERNDAFAERIDHQSATIDVLKEMSGSPGDAQPVLELIARRARELCDAETTGIFSFDGEMISVRCVNSVDMQSLEPYLETFPRAPARDYTIGRAILDRQAVEIDDADANPGLASVVHAHRNRSIITLPFLVDDGVVGGMSIAVRKPGGLTESQKALARTLAEQASIAIGAAAIHRQLEERTAALARSVEELQALENVLRAVNSSLDLDTVLETIIHRAVQLSQADEGTIYEFDTAEEVFVPKAAFGMTEDRVAALRAQRIRLGETHLGRSAVLRAPVHVEDVQQDPSIPNAAEILPGIHAVLAVPLLRDRTVIGGMVIRRRSETGFPPTIVTLMQTFAGQSVLAIENARLFQELAARGEEASRARAAAEAALGDLRRAQDQLVQSEKMASVGQLTAGIAHEIKNPLNFVNNFSDLSSDLLDELNEALAPEKLDLPADIRAEIDDLTATLKGNLQKITDHGRRADSIVKNMLLHSRSGSTERRATDVNAVTEEALNLAYHGARAEIPGFNIVLEKDLDPAAGMAEMFPQELIRVLVNLAGNGLYAARKRADAEPGFEPALRLVTRNLGDQVEIRVRDNGTGIPDTIRERIFEPFFTTKPPGEDTGLGLSLSYDIVVKQHGGRLDMHSAPDQYTEFVITLPRRPKEAGNPKEASP